MIGTIKLGLFLEIAALDLQKQGIGRIQKPGGVLGLHAAPARMDPGDLGFGLHRFQHFRNVSGKGAQDWLHPQLAGAVQNLHL